MAQLIADRRDVDFVLHEQMRVGDLTKHEKFAEFNKKTVDMIVSEARNLAIKEILPTQKESDEVGCTLENGVVKVPESFHRINKLYKEGEWLAMIDDPDWGGQGMPKTVSLAAEEYFIGANPSFMLYHGLSHGAANLINTLGTEEQKKIYLEKLYSGEWAGTMLLTEAGAGSDVGALETTATRNDDGTFNISGTKIFISGGEQNMVENIVHPTLARIEGAPPGTPGISLFLVPKYRVKDDGSPGEFNDVVCSGIEEKMGLHGNATCTLVLGGKGNCVGTLIGQENKGMRAMFLMMNEARQLVGLQGFGVATASYCYSLNYARERIQGKHLTAGKDPDAKPVPIIEHPDVRRQLMTMRAYVDGMRSLIYYGGMAHDLEVLAETPEEKEKYADRSAILTPYHQGLHHGPGHRRDQPGHPGIRRIRLYPGISGGAAHARCPHLPDIRGHQRHPGHGPAGPQTGPEKGRGLHGLPGGDEKDRGNGRKDRGTGNHDRARGNRRRSPGGNRRQIGQGRGLGQGAQCIRLCPSLPGRHRRCNHGVDASVAG